MYNNTLYTVSKQTPLYTLTSYEANLLPKVKDDLIEGEIPAIDARI